MATILGRHFCCRLKYVVLTNPTWRPTVDRGVAGGVSRHVIRDLIMPDQKVQPDQ